MNDSNSEDVRAGSPDRSRAVRALEDPAPFSRNCSRDWLAVLIVFFTALIPRLLFFYLNTQNNPSHDVPIMDALYYHDWARAIAAGNIWGGEVFFRAPLYPFFLALLHKISWTSIPFAVFCQHLMGSITCVFVFLLTGRFYSRRVSLLAGMLAALYWPFIFFESELLIVTLVLFLYTLFLVFLARALKTGGFLDSVFCGFLLGLSVIARPSILIFAPVVPLCFHLLRKRRGTHSAIRRLRQALIVISMCCLVILPVMIHNFRVGNAIVPIASSAGVNFYIGNNPTSDGRTAIVPGTDAPWLGGNEEAIAIAERAAGKELGPAQVSNYYFRQGLDFIKSQPGSAALLFLKKFRMFWTSEERSNDKFIYFFWDLSGMGKIPLPGFWIIAPLGLLGIFLQWRRRRELSMLYLFIAAYMLGVILFFVNARFRLPVVPALLVFASFSLHHLIAVCRENKKQFFLSVTVLAALAAAVNYDYFTIRKTRPIHLTISHYTLGSAWVQKGENEKAIEQYELAYENYAAHPSAAYAFIARETCLKLGALYWEKGEYRKSIRILRIITGEDEQSITARSILGDCYYRTGQLGNAVKTFAEILDIRPDDISALNGVIQSLAAGGRFDSALQVLEHAKNHFPVNDPRIVSLVEEIERMRTASE